MGGFDMPYEYDYAFNGMEAVGTGVIGVFAAIYALMMFFGFAFSAVCYVLQSLGMYTIAERRGIRNSWLAWIPLGNMWILGSISDQFQYLKKGKVKNRRKTLLLLGIGALVICFAWLASLISSLVMGDGIAAIFGTVGGVLLLAAIAIFLGVLEYMSYYDLFCSCQPSNGVLYLVLSILFPVTLPIFVFICRKKDLGMPPRKQPQVQEIIEVEPVEETEPVAEPEEGFAQPEEFIEE